MFQLKGSALKVLKDMRLFSACCWLGGGLALLALTSAKYAGQVDENAVYGLDLA
ncbi:MAG: hypothetical protein LBJ64_12100 [Deltaproteobacteria bacterium]|nr:hypothetical protein [Deltaproteobacteria bacterium]